MKSRFSAAKAVLKYYPKATVLLKEGSKKWFQVWNENTLLGQGQNRRCAWKAAYNNINN